MNKDQGLKEQPDTASSMDDSTQRALRMMAGFVIAAIIIFALYVGKEIFIPLALSVLLAFLLAPLVVRLKRWGLPQLPSIALVVLLALSVLGGAATYLGYQLSQLSQELPQYQDTIREKISSVKSYTSGPSVWDGAISTFETLEKSFKDVSPDEKVEGVPQVQVIGEQKSQTEVAKEWLTTLLSPLATAGIVFLFVVLILLSRKDLHDRMLKLLGGNLNVGTDALSEAADRIGTYLRMQLLVNVTYGLPMAIGLWMIGVPAAIMWGIVAVVMRFIPYVGPMISALFPITLAFAVDPGWNMVLWTVGLILLLELISNNVVEPWLYGESTGLSTLAIIIAATFWTSVWGPVGLILSTPLTACLLVLSNYIPALGFFKTLLGNEAVLSDEQRFYQRLVSDDVDEALEVAEQYIHQELPKKPSEEAVVRKVNAFYEDVAIPAIRLFSVSHDTDASAEHRLSMQQGLKLFNHEFQKKYPISVEVDKIKVACIGARWEIDVQASAMLAHGLNLRHIDAVSISETFLQNKVNLLEVLPASTEILCVSIFHQYPMAQVRLMSQKLRELKPELKLIFALWGESRNELRDMIQQKYQPEAIATTVNECLLSVDALMLEQGQNPARSILAENESERLEALHELELLSSETLPIYEQYIEEACQAFDVRYAQISLVDEDWVNTPASPLAEQSQHPMDAGLAREDSICTHLVHQNESLIIEDIDRDPRFRRNPELTKNNIKFYAGVPLRTKQGFVLGSLCILDRQTREMSEDDLELLNELGEELMQTLSHGRKKQQKLEEISKLQHADSVHHVTDEPPVA